MGQLSFFNIISIYPFENKKHNHQVDILLCTWDLNQQEPFLKRLLELVEKLHACKWEHYPWLVIVGWEDIYLQSKKI